MTQFKDMDVVKVRFNSAVYISDKENPFDPEEIYQDKNLAKGDALIMHMLNQKNVIHPGQIVELYWKDAKKYVENKKECFYHQAGLGVSYPSDPNWVKEISIAELVA